MTLASKSARADVPVLGEQHVLGMAEMGFTGLSEGWLMRRAGDLHWRLIAHVMGQRDAMFTCADGEPLYAAFCVSSLRLDAPHLPELGATLTLQAGLYRVGRSRLASLHEIGCRGKTVGRVALISTFVGREQPGSNRSVVRRLPRVMAVPPHAPPALIRLADRGARSITALSDLPIDARASRLMPCPATDFNAAGLLYFPSFAALTDRADHTTGAAFARLLVARDVVYSGNIDPGETLTIGFRPRPHGHLARITNADGRQLALLRSRFARAVDPA